MSILKPDQYLRLTAHPPTTGYYGWFY